MSSDSFQNIPRQWTRRNWVRSAGVAALTCGWIPYRACAQSLGDSAGLLNPVQQENLQCGTQDWLLTRTRVDESGIRCPWVEGYCSRPSYLAGEQIQVHVSASPGAKVGLDVYRMGFYGGAGGCWKRSFDPVPVQSQPMSEVGKNRVQMCEWKSTFEWTIPDDWLSGVYIGKLTESNEGLQSYVIFIIRDERQSDLLYHCSDNTWQAYNRWPSKYSLYDSAENEWHWGPNTRVSYQRPYGKYRQIMDAPLSLGSGEFFLWEFPMVYWLESEGLDVSYQSNTDTHNSPDRLLKARGLLSTGHDEYWTLRMFRNVQRAVQKGVSVGFFSGNAVCGRVEWNPGELSFERVGVFGPPGGTREFVQMQKLKHERPYANELIGAHSTGPVTGGADWICSDPKHWVYENTGMKAGERIPGLIGWEWHGDPADIPGLEIVATGPTQSSPGQLNGGIYTATVYPGPKRNIVFNAATCWWADGLSEPPGYVRPAVYTKPQGPDLRVQQITRNVIHEMVANRK